VASRDIPAKLEAVVTVQGQPVVSRIGRFLHSALALSSAKWIAIFLNINRFNKINFTVTIEHNDGWKSCIKLDCCCIISEVLPSYYDRGL